MERKIPDKDRIFWLESDHDALLIIREYDDLVPRVFHFNNIELYWTGGWTLPEFFGKNFFKINKWKYVTREDVMQHAKEHSYSSTYHVKNFLELTK